MLLTSILLLMWARLGAPDRLSRSVCTPGLLGDSMAPRTVTPAMASTPSTAHTAHAPTAARQHLIAEKITI